jgi:hypothetical protein
MVFRSRLVGTAFWLLSLQLASSMEPSRETSSQVKLNMEAAAVTPCTPRKRERAAVKEARIV